MFTRSGLKSFSNLCSKVNYHSKLLNAHHRGLICCSSVVNSSNSIFCLLTKRNHCSDVQTTLYSATHVRHPYSYAYGVSSSSLEYLTIGDALREASNKRGEAVAIISDHEKISKTFGELNREVDQLANSLSTKMGLKRGDVVALWSANCYNWILVQLACARRGLILCTLNPVYKLPELEYALIKSGARVLFLPGQQSAQSIVNDFSGIGESISFDRTKLEKLVTIDGNKLSTTLPCLHLDDIIDSNTQADEENVNSDDPAIIMFTSGTTGKPKGALLSHYNLINNAHLTGQRLGLDEMGTVACIPVPLFHIFGLVYGIVMMSRWAMTMVLTGYRYKVDSLLKAVNDHKCTHIMIVPAMTVDIVNYIEKNHTTLPSLKTVVTGSAPTTVATVQKFLKNIPGTKSFLIRYGSTETGGCMTMPHRGDLPEQTMDNVGAPLDLTEVKIVDRKTGHLMPIGEQGELMVRGHHVMLGYWEDPDKTREAINSSNWFISGDIATMDDKGYIKLVGRAKELIIRGGENVYPKEVEELLYRHPLIAEAHVCGVPDERMGEELCAWIKLKNPEDKEKINTDEIRQFCKDKISYFKVPRYVLVVDDFPRTPTGKAQKFMMTEQSIKLLNLKS
ncbi:medium-chain acyl-CoA ligase ACSF2, mitochondrial-like [Brevipalpus obovatus]|uniref:medium-chain acyl-CoA ligase ACSF2, mitochondrial-like n=1 Tax=Brevipalpus obovatus TaxID=246614 RepID=UPI003D9E3B45